MDLNVFVHDLLIVLLSGLLAGAVCKRIGVSMLVGYLVVGALIGRGVLNLVTQENHELEYLAEAGALFLLFAVGIEFSLEALVKLSRYFLVGGAIQMLLVAVPLAATFYAFGMEWNAAVLMGAAGALSSTVLVFKALAEWGQTASPHGRRAIGILLFQDVALVPLMLLIPLVTLSGEAPGVTTYALLALKSIIFVAAVIALRWLVAQLAIPALGRFRSVELIILFSLSLLGGVCWVAHWLGLPAAIGALAAGLILSGNRLSKQVDTIVLPFRETFAAVFFVTLGTLMNPFEFINEPLTLTGGLFAILALKGVAAAVALKLTGLGWPAALGMGLGLAQLGEFSFLVLAEGVAHDVISRDDYNRMLFIALGTLILTPLMLKFGIRWTDGTYMDVESGEEGGHKDRIHHAIVVGIGPIGRQLASRLEINGVAVCLIDLSPINLHSFAQQGFDTVAGDARDPAVLRRAGVRQCRLAVVSVPVDETAHQIVQSLRSLNPQLPILVRCRFQDNVGRLKKAGANAVVSEEAEATGALLQRCEKLVAMSNASNR